MQAVKQRCLRSGLLYFSCLALAASAAAAADVDQPLSLDLAKIIATDATVSARPGAASVLTVATGHRELRPGVVLPAPSGRWDLSSYAQVALQVTNTGAHPVTVVCRVDNPGADSRKNCIAGELTIRPGRTDTLRVYQLRTRYDTLGGKLFGMKGYPVSAGGDGAIDPTNVTQLMVYVYDPKEDYNFEISQVRATVAYTPPTAWVTDADPFFPFIDTFGQYRHKDWPGKTHSVAELVSRRAEEAKDLAAHPGPEDWDKYGGSLTGPRLKATGFFRTEKIAGKWWLVDPDGHPFFSHGVDCVQPLNGTPIDDRETWFADFPGKEPEFAGFFSKADAIMDYYKGRTVRAFSFASVNLLRKYGPDWRALSSRIAHQRLRSWGLNTIANWSDRSTYMLRLTPYTDWTNSAECKLIEGSEGYWGKFPDVFDPSFAAILRERMETKRGKTAGDPLCIGYFSDNELPWGDDVSLAVATLKSPPDQPAKKAFVADLQARYGDIAKLNQAWGTAHVSWEALLRNRDAPDARKAQADLGEFYSKIAEQYFRTTRDAIKAVAPNQLYLGCRFAGVNARAAAAAAKYCDVVSYNIYERSVADFEFTGGADVPLLVGEFHFGAQDRGVFHPGLARVANQAERAQAYRDYVLGALRHPQFVGCHWFEYQDEPVTGRPWDGENYQDGILDVCDTPYPELVEASRAVGAALYRR
jgi:hypothetical protein